MVITLCAWNRPEYLTKVLDGLAACHRIANCTLIACVEPGPPEVRALLDGFVACQVQVVQNPTRLGVRDNTKQALSLGFARSDFVIHLEDDIVPAPDALTFFEYCRVAYQDDKSVFTVTGYSGPRYDWAGGKPEYEDMGYKTIDLYARDEYYLLRRIAWFHTSGWATWRDRWLEMRDNWETERGDWGPRVNRVIRGQRSEVYPILARTQNIGANGVHIKDEQWFYQYVHNAHWAGSLSLPPGEYHEP